MRLAGAQRIAHQVEEVAAHRDTLEVEAGHERGTGEALGRVVRDHRDVVVEAARELEVHDADPVQGGGRVTVQVGRDDEEPMPPGRAPERGPRAR